jgi:hypothetical protein
VQSLFNAESAGAVGALSNQLALFQAKEHIDGVIISLLLLRSNLKKRIVGRIEINLPMRIDEAVVFFESLSRFSD